MVVKEERYQLTFSRFNTDSSGVSDHYTFKGNDLAVVLSQLPLAIATVMKKEQIATMRNITDDDIPF